MLYPQKIRSELWEEIDLSTKRTRKGTYKSKQIFKPFQFIDQQSSDIFLRLDCIDCDYIEHFTITNINRMSIFDGVYAARFGIESHYSLAHGIEPTKEQIMEFLKKNKVIRGKYTLMSRLIDELGYKYFYGYKIFNKIYRYNNKIAIILNQLGKEKFFKTELEGNTYVYTYTNDGSG